MKSLKQLAEEIGVSKQAVYKRYTGKLFNECSPYVTTEYSKLMFDETAEAIIKKDFIDNPSIDRTRSTEGADTENSVYDELRVENTDLKLQLADKDKTIAVLEVQLRNSMETIESLKADKQDMQKYRDKLTDALMISSADAIKLEDIIRKLAAATLRARLFKWSDTVKALTADLKGEGTPSDVNIITVDDINDNKDDGAT